ncbi:hypothetical protein CUJ87_31845 (plasmid) [Paraburkholderia caledonica]|nr:hypothetical protein CUJ87_31845 [Paraburkholderia caledonica]
MSHGTNGFETGRLVRSDYPKIRVVLTSGYSPAALRDGKGGLSDVLFVPKPYRLADLAKALRA